MEGSFAPPSPSSFSHFFFVNHFLDWQSTGGERKSARGRWHLMNSS